MGSARNRAPMSGLRATLKGRYAVIYGERKCFVCSLPLSMVDQAIHVRDERDRHSRQAHTFCFDMLLRYCQVVFDEQATPAVREGSQPHP